MVATRRGVRVCSPSKTNPEQPNDVPATPSTARRTRRTAKQEEQEESPTRDILVGTCSHVVTELGHPASPPSSSLRRSTRASRLHSPEPPSTPVGSVHEADVSDVESCCSAVMDVDAPISLTRSRRRLSRKVRQKDDKTSEVESSSSVVSASKAGQGRSRSTRRKIIPHSSEPAQAETGDAKGDLALEGESCSSMVSEPQRVTRSTRASAKPQTEDSELSDADSVTSSVSGLEVSKSVTRRGTRSTRRTGPIPIYLEESSESSLSSVPMNRRSKAARGKAASGQVSEPQSCDSEGFESGPTHRMATRRRGKVLDSDSDLTDVCSPMGKGTPCSSRTGSGTSSRSALASTSLIKDLTIVLKKAAVPAEVDMPLDNSMLESTVIAEDADCTLLEEDETQAQEEKEDEGVNGADVTSNEADLTAVEKGAIVSEEGADVSPPESESPAGSEEAVGKPAVTVRYQQEEPCDENKDGDLTEMEVMQEIAPSSEPIEPCQSDTVILCATTDQIPEETEEKDEAMEEADADTQPSLRDEAVDEDAVVEAGPSEEEKTDVSALNSDAQQVVEGHAEPIQVTAAQQSTVTVDPGPEQQPRDVIVRKRDIISLLDSSDEEEGLSDEEEGEVSGEEEEKEEEEEEEEEEELLGHMAEERAGPSRKPEAAGTSVDGLFMIDTRPGQEADELYYKETPAEEEEGKARKHGGVEQEEQDEEFVDEEGDEEDEDTSILFSSRNPLLKEMSSRIDPGIRMKELGGLYINFDGSKSKPVSSSLQKLKENKIQDEVMKKSVIGPDFEKKDAVPPYSESKQALKLKHRVEREKSTGDAWFNMKAPELTQELKGDLQVLRMRGSMDPKRFYKKNDRDGFPKYFQVGTVVDNPVDFYHSRIPKKDRKRTMVEELLADAEFRHKNKKKYQQILAEKAAQGAGRRNKKKNKFHRK